MITAESRSIMCYCVSIAPYSSTINQVRTVLAKYTRTVIVISRDHYQPIGILLVIGIHSAIKAN